MCISLLQYLFLLIVRGSIRNWYEYEYEYEYEFLFL